MPSESVFFMLSSIFGWCVSYWSIAWMIFNLNLTLKHQKLMLHDLQILLLPGNKQRLRQNDPMLQDIHLQLAVFLRNWSPRISQILPLMSRDVAKNFASRVITIYRRVTALKRFLHLPGDFGRNADRGTRWHSIQSFGGPFHSKILTCNLSWD